MTTTPTCTAGIVQVSCTTACGGWTNIGVADRGHRRRRLPGSMQARAGPGRASWSSGRRRRVRGRADDYEFSITVRGTTFRSYAAPTADTGEATGQGKHVSRRRSTC